MKTPNSKLKLNKSALHESISKPPQKMCNSVAVIPSSDQKHPPPSQIHHQKPDLEKHSGEETVTSVAEITCEATHLFNLAFPIALTALIVYFRSIISMIFLGQLGNSELAAGSLAIAFANITGYSVLSGLALGMEPLCSQAFGARRPKLLSLTLHRSIIFLLISGVPISFLWLNLSQILTYLRQDMTIISLSQTYLVFTLPDLFTNSLIHPIRIYLRAQGITHPLTLASVAGAIIHYPLNYVFVTRFRWGVAGVAVASSTSNVTMLIVLISYIWISGIHLPTWSPPTRECLTGWKPLIRLAAPSCISVCLEWWWYEIMIILCGIFVDPKASVASMGILIQTTSFLYIFPSSLGFAVSTRVGNELGANRPGKARGSARISICLALAMGAFAMAFAVGMRNIWAKMFTNDLEILRLTSAALPIIGVCELGNCPQTVGCGVVRGMARPTTAARVNLGAFYLVGMPVAIWIGFGLKIGFCGLWIGLLAAQICCAVLMLCVVGYTDWDVEAERAQKLTFMIGPHDLINQKEPLIDSVSS